MVSFMQLTNNTKYTSFYKRQLTLWDRKTVFNDSDVDSQANEGEIATTYFFYIRITLFNKSRIHAGNKEV